VSSVLEKKVTSASLLTLYEMSKLKQLDKANWDKLSPSNASTPALNSASAPVISESEKIDL